MTFKIYFEILEEVEIEDSLDREIMHIIVSDVVDGVIDSLEEQNFKITLKKIDRES